MGKQWQLLTQLFKRLRVTSYNNDDVYESHR